MDPEPTGDFLRDVLSGGIAGCMEHAGTFPLDTVKTLMQREAGRGQSIISTVRSVIRREGWMRFYRGMTPIVASAFPAHAAFFSCYEASKRLMNATEAWQFAVAGAASTCAHDFVSVPFDVVKQRMQADIMNKRFTSSLSCLKTVLRDRGLAALFVSLPTTVLMNIPQMSTHWVVYEATRRAVVGSDSGNAAPWRFFVCGSIAGSCAGAASTPFDVVRTKLQLGEFPGAFQAVRSIYLGDGALGFFRGLTPRVLAMAPSGALVMTTYELCQRFFKKYDFQKPRPAMA